jgi:hypothetical protein
MDKHFAHLDMNIRFRKANPLAESDPAVPDLDPRTVRLAQGSVHAEGAYPLPSDIDLHQDVAVPTRAGTTLRADIYRPVTDQPVPAIVVYTPYTKRGGWWNKHFNATNFGVPAGDLSGLQAFESPDPGYWCHHGYAVAVVDAAGTAQSGGDEVFMGTASGRNAYDAVEWVAAQDWCTGKIGMAGNSQLAMIQWATAALQPPHLTAFAPWEGLIDVYRENMLRGGIPDCKFHDEDIAPFIYGQNNTEDLSAMGDQYPLMNAYWADKRPELDRITIPAYVVASWTSPIHPHGTLEAFREISSTSKWLRVHNDQEWLDGADPNNVRDLRRFFDRFLKDVDNGWEATPRVRLSVLNPGGTDTVGRPENEWPLARQQWRKLFLDAGSHTLASIKAPSESVSEYDGDDLSASVRFTTEFGEDTEITGHLNLHLWVEAADANDMDLFAAVYKEDQDGNRLHHITLRAPESREYVRSLEQDGKLPATLSYTGPVGRLRVSHRALDEERSTPEEPVLAHTREDLLDPGECVPVELTLWPTSMLVHSGERLVVEIAGHPVGPQATGTLPGANLTMPTRNRGKHRIRTGGQFDSHLQLPIIP